MLQGIIVTNYDSLSGLVQQHFHTFIHLYILHILSIEYKVREKVGGLQYVCPPAHPYVSLEN